jgi:DNA mismatch repair protein MutS
MDKKKYSPMVEHYLKVKAQNPDALLFYRLGDFYEMFFEDARIASDELDLVLTARAAGNGEKIDMCGIPYHAVQPYLQRLVKKGYKIAICEQLSDPATSKGLVERDIIRIVTPGTYMEEGLDSSSYNYMASVAANGWQIAVVFAELSCSSLKVSFIDRSLVSLNKILKEMNVSEVLVDKSFDKKWIQSLQDQGFLISIGKKEKLAEKDRQLLCSENGLEEEALALLMSYLVQTQKQSIDSFEKAEAMNEQAFLQMDYETKNHLELTRSFSSSAKAQTLFSFMDKTRTAMGSRMLKSWIENPLAYKEQILKRQQAVAEMKNDFMLREQILDELDGIYDLERIAGRISFGNAKPKDIVQLISSLAHAQNLLPLMENLNSYPEFRNIDPCSALYEKIKDSIVENPPATLKDGGVFASGYSAELDHVRKIADEGKNYILELEAKERERTGVKSLKIGYNRVFGYYIDVRNGNLGNIKEEFGYQTRQNLANSTRFVTDELKEREEEILSAQERKITLEQSLFDDLIAQIKEQVMHLHALSKIIACADALCSMAVLANEKGYVAPQFNDNHEVHIEEGKHPILEQRLDNFVSNDWNMPSSLCAQMITGPNMGGKSTYMRQNALLVIMAQMGSFLPVRFANLPVFDKIFTRIGASDDLLTGKSTFMMEMLEANQALQYATSDSLILFDEIGRGTATYDGMALAQSMLEYILSAIHAKTLFSTHYHELTNLCESYDSIENIHVDVKEKKHEIEFRYRLIPGKADKSYGINVARLARLPESVIDRAGDLLKQYEQSDNQSVYQPNLFVMEQSVPQKNQIMEQLAQLDVDDLSAREALDCLYELKKLYIESERK